MGFRRVPDEQMRCDATTTQGARCLNYGTFISVDGAWRGKWCGQHHPGWNTVPYAIASWTSREARAAVETIPEHVHGTLTGYTNHRCRCDPCRSASTKYRAKRRAAARSEPMREDQHGTLNGYQNWGCRCMHCTEAAYQYNLARRTAGDDKPITAAAR